MAGQAMAMPAMQPLAARVQAAQTTPAAFAAEEARARQARLRRHVIGGGLALAAGALWVSGYLGVVLPILVIVVFYLGWRSLTRSVSRGIGVAAVSALDRVTGLQVARDRAESAAAQAGPRGLQHGTLQQGALIESREAGSVPRRMAMLRWAPFALGVVGLVGMAAWQGGSEGVQRLGHDLIAPFTGASPSVVQAHSAPKASAPAEAVTPARVADPAAAQVAPVMEPAMEPVTAPAGGRFGAEGAAGRDGVLAGDGGADGLAGLCRQFCAALVYSSPRPADGRPLGAAG